MKLIASLIVLPKTENPKTIIVTLTVPHLSLSITMDKKKIRLLFSHHNSIKMESKLAKFENNYFMVRHARITTVTTLVQKIIGSTMRGASSFLCNDGHLGH